MNFVFISPNFPERFYKFTESLKRVGFTVLGIGDCPYFDLHERCRNSLDEYYGCWEMNNQNARIAAVAYFEKKYGHIDYLESNNEYWLENDAVLREWFNITTGQWPADMKKIKSKEEMKKYFKKAGVKVARYVIAKNIDICRDFIAKVDYPVFAKPVIGVGAQQTFKISNDEDLVNFFANKDQCEYIMEEFLDGEIVSFDGVCNSNSDVVFADNEHFPTPIDKVVKGCLDNYYYVDPNIPEDFYEMGKRVVKEFGIKKRFFHIEFFKLNKDKKGLGKKGDYIGLEVNMRPPGGTTPDLINFSSSVSCYDIWADVMMYDENREYMQNKKYVAIAICRRDHYQYIHNDEDIYQNYGHSITMGGRNPDALKDALGDSYFYAKFETLKEAMAFKDFCLSKNF